MISVLESSIGRKAIVNYEDKVNGDMTDTAADISKAKSQLAWEPHVSPEVGLEATAEWHVANHEWLKDIRL